MIEPERGVSFLMRELLRKRVSIGSDSAPIDALVLQIGKLVRYRGFARDKVVSGMLLKYIPTDAGYAWNGEAALQARLEKAALDTKTMDHLIASARIEIVMIQSRSHD